MLANKANGILVYAQSGVSNPGTISVSSGKLVLSNAANITSAKYTDDGSNPKTSETAKTLTSGTTTAPASGTKIKVVSSTTGSLDSGIVEYTIP